MQNTQATARAYLALGSNLGDRVQTMQRAVRLLSSHAEVSVVSVSSLYETAPMYVLDQPAFLNACVEVETTLLPEALLQWGQQVERELGRQRVQDKGPRTIDVDLLLYDALILEACSLQIPHPMMSERAFVLEPLAEIAAEAWHPTASATIGALLEACPGRDTVQRMLEPWCAQAARM